MGPTHIGGSDLSLLNLPEEESLIEHGGESAKGSAYPTRPCEKAFPERVLLAVPLSHPLHHAACLDLLLGKKLQPQRCCELSVVSEEFQQRDWICQARSHTHQAEVSL